MPARADPSIDAAVLLERRRAQNRLAQHRFRQRKLAAAQAAGTTIQPKKPAAKRNSQKLLPETGSLSPSHTTLHTIPTQRATPIKLEEFESPRHIDMHAPATTAKNGTFSTRVPSTSFVDMLTDFGDSVPTSLPSATDISSCLFESSSSCSPLSTSSPAGGSSYSGSSSAASPSTFALGSSLDSAFYPPTPVPRSAAPSTAPVQAKVTMTQTCFGFHSLPSPNTIPPLDAASSCFYGALGLSTNAGPCATASSAGSAGSAAAVYPLWMDSCSQ